MGCSVGLGLELQARRELGATTITDHRKRGGVKKNLEGLREKKTLNKNNIRLLLEAWEGSLDVF